MLNEEVLELCEYIASYSDAEDVDMDVARGRRVTKEKSDLQNLSTQFIAPYMPLDRTLSLDVSMKTG